MKLFLKRIFSDEAGFQIYDDLGNCRYSVTVETETRRQRILINGDSAVPVSEIFHKNFFMRYFTVRCQRGFYVLLPSVRDCFSFRIYGSSYCFAGDIASGRFSLFDVDRSVIMTQKKCWCRYGDAYELNILVPEDEHFALSVAICAAIYISASETSTVLSG
ncbi:MAG: hypothetical protein IJU51_06145 [Clostridia bacterium]|nr:hypothetical protein [Clostridia bacterium]